MSEKKFHETREFRKLQRAWYKKLEETEFYDIEGGVEGHLLKGPSSTISLRSLANRKEGGLKNDHAHRTFDDVADSECGTLDYPSSAKGRYYHHSQLLAVQAIREGVLCDEACFTWWLHSQGEGERSIVNLLEISRGRIRKYLEHLRHNIFTRIDNDHR